MSTSISEDFKDAKINLMLEDLLKLEKEILVFRDALIAAISEVPGALDEAVTIKLKSLLKAGEELESNIEESKKNIIELQESAKHEITKHFALVLADLKGDLKKLSESYHTEIKKTKPVSISKIALIIIVFSLVLSSVCSGSLYYILSSKYQTDLKSYGNGIVELSELTDEVISQLPKDKKDVAKQKYKYIMSKNR
ncbi:hypothetical protein IFG57_004015 [Salmonella enterica]|nr:hypothetical protein [Salmonella enterica]